MNHLDPVLLRGLTAIEPYLDEVVIAGGWVPHLYELLYDSTKAGRSPRTRDIDLAVPRSVAVKGESIDQLLKAADFDCLFFSASTPPVTRYVAKDDTNIEIEFITDAPGASETAIAVQPDLTAQELHYVGLLLENPWTVELKDLTSGEVDYAVRVPTPGAFVFHKALVSTKRRDRVKASKDLYYIFFVLDQFPEWRPALASQLAELANRHRTWFKRCHRNMTDLFGSPDSDGVGALLKQRPQTAFPGMTDEQFRQYSFSAMSGLVGMMDAALSG